MKVDAWHFVRDNYTCGHGARRRVEPGQVRVHRGEIVPCSSGLHASVRAIDALGYAPGSIVCRVRCSGRIVHHGDKIVCSRREVLWVADAETELRSFARWCALQAIHLWDAPTVVRQYLETGDEALRATAWSALRDAARDAAQGAARIAAWDAARSAARSAAWDASRATARAAAWSAARSAARTAHNAELERRLLTLGEGE